MLEVDRLKDRAGDMVIEIKTRRTDSQVEALRGVEDEISRLVETVERDVGGAGGEAMCKGFIAACGGEVVGQRLSCQKFEKMVLGCALVDQKMVKIRLEELLGQIREIRTAESDMIVRIDTGSVEAKDISNDNKKVEENKSSDSQY